ncbi:MAG: riboflavin synthase [Gemmatimonadaceae bacterium]|nr:riboflavin synthase [Gemmatimonadaceae bacterium]
MFTGLIDDIGTIDAVAADAAGRTLRVRARYADLVDGESIAVNGACLTVREHGDGWFTVAAVVTTLERTTIGDWAVGQRLNLERALRLGDRLGGHLVQGHVDGVATVTDTRRHGDAWLIDLDLPPALQPLMVPLGSVAVDGVSLTVNALHDPDGIQLSIIEYTERHTTLGALRAGDRVHVEADMIAKHVARLSAPHRPLAAVLP